MRVGIFLITLALITGMVGCGGDSDRYYTLTISSTSGGLVTIPGEGTTSYREGAIVDLVAQTEEGYNFVGWSGDVETVANVGAATTNITMIGHYHITANFGLQIRNWYDLDAVRGNLDGHHILMNNLDSTTSGYEALASPIANEGKGWQPIGAWVYLESFVGLDGTFDGQGYEIRDLYINRSDQDSCGLFGAVGDGVIKNIGVVNVCVFGKWFVGGLVGENRGTVSNSYSAGSVTGTTFVGGLVGHNSYVGTVSDCYSTASVAGTNGIAGGLVGDNLGILNDSHFTGSVAGGWAIGGVVGLNSGTLSKSRYNYDEVLINGEHIITYGALFASDFEEWLANDKSLDITGRLSQEDGYYLLNDVSDFKEVLAFGYDGSLKFKLKNDLDLAADPDFYIPYLAGEFDGNGHKISNLSLRLPFVEPLGLFGCLAVGGKVTHMGVENVSITGRGAIGGLAGANGGTISNCYSTGNLTGEICIGGLVGGNSWDSIVSNSYSTASVTGGCCYLGGLIGDNGGTVSNSYSTGDVTGSYFIGGLVGSNGHTVSNSYSIGSVTGNHDVGGLAGQNSGTVNNSFWDIETSGQLTSAGGTGKTTAQMKSITTFSGAVWDIVGVANPDIRNTSYIWNIVDGVTYPFLSWEPVA